MPRFMRFRALHRGAIGLFALVACASPAYPQAGENLDQALCRLIETSARARNLPPAFLTRLIWRESSFRPGAVSSAGAQGVAQFMPGTAAERGLSDPFDPEAAIPASAALLADLRARFGNLGLAAAAYNSGPRRVEDWLSARGGLPLETRDYVLAITGREVEDWIGAAKDAPDDAAQAQPCLTIVAAIRQGTGAPKAGSIAEGPLAPWGVQIAGNFSKARALSAFSRVRTRYAGIFDQAGTEAIRPMVIGTRLRSRGTRPFYRVRIGAPDRKGANALCQRLRQAGGACIVLPS